MARPRLIQGTPAHYARHRKAAGLDGCSQTAVLRAMAQGRIPSPNADGVLDFAECDAAWLANTAPTEIPRTERHRKGIEDAERAKNGEPPIADNVASPTGQPAAAMDSYVFAAERAKREHFQASLAQLELKRRSGELLPKEEVEEAWSAMIAATRNRLLLIAAKCAPRLGGVTDVRERQAIIDREIREALTSLSEELALADVA